MKSLYIIVPLIIIILFYINNQSSFGNIEEIVETKCNPPVDGQIIPRGHLPGSYIILSDSERKELLKTFIENGPEVI
jgi:hypothetical protein